MKVQRGDVIIIDFPFTDASGTKVRPALVVQDDRRNAKLAETIVVFITKNLGHVGSDSTQLFIDVTSAYGQATGLTANSAVKCGKLFTVHERMIRKKIGVFSTTLMQQINVCLKEALNLP